MVCYKHPRKILVDTLQRLYDYGMTTTSGGNLSMKDEDGNIWITPSGIDKGTLRYDDVMLVKPNGEVIGKHRPSVELPFHRAVYNLRPDVKAVLHAHSPALVAFSLVGRMPDASLFPGCETVCGKVAFAKYDIPGSEGLGKLIAAEFERGADSVVMENHGAVMAGDSIAQAFRRFETLDFIARTQIHAQTLNAGLKTPGTAPAPVSLPEFKPDYASPYECELRDSLVAFHARCYRQQLLFSGSAFLSARLGADDFLITASNFDPLDSDSSDVVRIAEGRREAGKNPSKSAAFCREIYQKCPWAKAVFMMRPPNAMAFASTGIQMDSRTIPESYIQLRDIPFVSSDEFLNSPEKTIARLTPSSPVLMIENCGVVTTGKSIVEAFDRLEVAEFTAKCLILAARIGNFKPITQAQVDAIIEAFGLPK